jgi:hypothetical protein
VALDQGLPRGPWRARPRLTSGQLRRTVTATIMFPRRAGGPAVSRVPWLTLAVILLLTLLAITVAALGISRRRNQGGRVLR